MQRDHRTMLASDPHRLRLQRRETNETHLKRVFLFLVLLGIVWPLHSADMTISKKVVIELGQTSYPYGDLTNSPAKVFPFSDSSYIAVGPDRGSTTIWRKFTAGGELVWSNRLYAPVPSSLVNIPAGLAGVCEPDLGYGRRTLFVIANGTDVTTHQLPAPLENVSYWNELTYTSLIAEEDGLLVCAFGEPSGGARSTFLMKVSLTNYQKIWQTGFTGGEGLYGGFGRIFPRPQDGCYIAYDEGQQYYHTIASVLTNGTTQWRKSVHGNITTGGQDKLVTIIPCRSGSVLLGFTSSTSGWDKTAPHYGAEDIWLVKLDKSGNQVWDRSFGGAGYDGLSDLKETQDGGFLVLGETAHSQVSGNKSVDGDGLWLLKLDRYGRKESEAVIPARPVNYRKLLSAPDGYPIAADTWLTRVTAYSVVELNVRSLGVPFRLDYSHDLLNWTNFIPKLNGNLLFQEEIGSQNKFFRCTDLP